MSNDGRHLHDVVEVARFCACTLSEHVPEGTPGPGPANGLQRLDLRCHARAQQCTITGQHSWLLACTSMQL